MAEEPVDILLVEDDTDQADLALLALKSAGCTRVKRLADGAMALDYLLGPNAGEGAEHVEPPRVILLDVKLPKIDGIEVLRRVKSHPHTKNIPIVMLTTSFEKQDMLECYAAGANSFVLKSADFAEFTNLVASLVHYWLNLNQLPL